MAEPDKKMDDGVEEIVIDGDKAVEKPSVPTFTLPADLSTRLSGLMQNPEVLAALQDKLGSMIGGSSGYIQNLPKPVKRRLKALKKLQFETIKIESKFYEEVHELECKYADKYASLFERRRDIVTAGVEPTDSDCEWPSDEEEDAEDDEEVKLSNDLAKKVVLGEGDSENKENKENGEKEKKEGEESEKEKDEEDDDDGGVPEFWLTVFKNVDMLAEMVQEHDEKILKHLHDIRVEFSKIDPMGFTLHFHFAPNDFFTNTVITKEYLMRSEPDDSDPFNFEGPEIIKCKGCKIDWKSGKNITVKLIKKVQKHQLRGTKRTVTRTVQNDSFFNFFSPPEVVDGVEPDEDTEALLAADFEIGHFIRERIVPRAVLYFTGEALDDDFDEGEDEEGDEDEEAEDEDEENDPDFVP